VLDASGRALADQLAGLRSGDGLIMLAFGTPYREAVATLREAGRIGLTSILLTDRLDGKLTGMASLSINVQRGDARHVALMGAPFAALEAIALGLAVADPAAATAALDKLNRLRAMLDPVPR
jgi:DNA-binding MurR/RpiR family transcriptional regulator